jgi:hypothetical protein
MAQSNIERLCEDNTFEESPWKEILEELPRPTTDSDTESLSLTFNISNSPPQEVVEENLPREYAKKVIISGHVNLFVFWHNNCIRISKL